VARWPPLKGTPRHVVKARESTLIERVRSFARRHELWAPGSRVAAAVSGGSDSVALGWILRDLADAGELVFAGVAHLHHHLRGDAADGDAEFVAALAARLGVPVEIGHDDVAARARDERCSDEVAARRSRLAFLDIAADGLGADVVALAHTRGDQAETVLLRLARGGGPRGLAAMSPRTGRRARPLLDVSRHELRGWLAARGETWREDATNAEIRIPRNRVRHAVMPHLSAINPRAEEAIARAARILAADTALLDEVTAAAAARALTSDGRTVRIAIAELARLSDALARRVVLRALETLDPSRAYACEDAEAALSAIRRGHGHDLPGVRMERMAADAVLSERGPRGRVEPARPVEVPLVVPGIARASDGRWEIEALGPLPPGALAEGPRQAVFDAEALGGRLTVRGWRPGDRVRPVGLGGTKKLQDVFVDRKVPRDERGLVPIVTDARDRIAWVAGHVVAEPFGATSRSAAVVILTLRA
jgi:tRNA(Ile)-lysidine synthase